MLGIWMPSQRPPKCRVCRPHDHIRGRLVHETFRKGERRRADIGEGTKCVGRKRKRETTRGSTNNDVQGARTRGKAGGGHNSNDNQEPTDDKQKKPMLSGSRRGRRITSIARNV